MNTYFFVILAILAGMMMPTRAAINNKLAESVQSPILATFVPFVVGTIGLLLYMVAAGAPPGNLSLVKEAPAITWIGGLLGAFFVASAVVLAPRLGVALTFSLIMAGQILVALVIDHFGFPGFL